MWTLIRFVNVSHVSLIRKPFSGEDKRKLLQFAWHAYVMADSNLRPYSFYKWFNPVYEKSSVVDEYQAISF